MGEMYIAGDWAMVRKDEIVDLPRDLTIHADFLGVLSERDFSEAFRAVHGLFHRIYADIAESPAHFGLPVLRTGEAQMGPEYNEARSAADRPFYLLLYLFACGAPEGDRFFVDVARFRRVNVGTRAVLNIAPLMEGLSRHGFAFEGLRAGSLPRGASRVAIAYPDPAVLTVLHPVAAKCHRFLENGGFARFRTWNPRLLTEPADVLSFGGGAEHVADSVRDSARREAIFAFHDEMTEKGYRCEVMHWHEGPMIRYFEPKGKGAYLFEIMKNRSDVTLRLRIRSAEACMEYLAGCPESVKEMFRRTDPGCDRRRDGTCVSSTRYRYEGEEKWRCGCWGAPFFAPLDPGNYPHYLALVALGKDKPKKSAG